MPFKLLFVISLSSLDQLKNVKYCYILGDFNISLSNYSSNNVTCNFVDSVLDAKFLPYVYMPTRFSNHSPTIIDHVYSNDLFIDKYICKTGLVINDIADHCANFMFLVDTDPKVKIMHSNEVKIRNFSKINREKFKNSLSATDWSLVFSSNNPSSSLDTFLNIFTEVHDKSFPVIKASSTIKTDKKWITPALLKSINVKCKLYKKWIKSKKTAHESKYKKYAKCLRKLLQAAERQYYSNLFDSNSHNTKTIWRNINNLLNPTKAKGSVISSITKDGISYDQPLLIANQFNEYFCGVAHSLSNSTQGPALSSPSFQSFLAKPISNSFCLLKNISE